MKIDITKGRVVYTRGIADLLDQEIWADVDLNNVIVRHIKADWTLDEMYQEDIDMNTLALDESREDRILSVFKQNGIKVYVITEWDRSVTTILLPSEY